jgi:hypothetical protein
MSKRKETGRRERLTPEERERFLAVLRETGNRSAAAAAIGVEARLMDQRREHDAELDRAWEAAAEDAHRRLSGATGPFDVAQDTTCGTSRDRPLNMIRRGKRGRLQLVATGEGRWSAEVEERFKSALRETGNVRAAARAVGFSESSVWQRRRQWPAFARALEEMLEEAELALEFRIASMASNVVAKEKHPSASSRTNESAASFDMDDAMRFLKWREEKRRGGKRRTPRARLPTIEEVTEKLVRRVEAIKRHRRPGGGN